MSKSQTVSLNRSDRGAAMTASAAKSAEQVPEPSQAAAPIRSPATWRARLENPDLINPPAAIPGTLQSLTPSRTRM